MSIAIPVTSTVIALLVAEGLTRLFVPIPLHPTDTFLEVGNQAIRTADAAPRWLRPNVEARHREDDFDVMVTTNSRGLRDREFAYAKRAGVKRVLSTGDSFAFGYGVSLEESYAKRAEALLGDGWEVINGAVPSWGTADELDFLLTEGLKYTPDIVVLCYFRNDLHDNRVRGTYHMTPDGRAERCRPLIAEREAAGEAAVLAVKDPILADICATGAMGNEPEQPPQGAGWWATHSNLFRLVRQAVSRTEGRLARPADASPATERDYERRLTALLLADVAKACSERGIRTIVMLMPSREEAQWEREPGGRGQREPSVSTAVAEEAGAQVLDLAPMLAAAGPEAVYFPHNAHISAHGHAVVAQALVEAIRNPEVKGR